LFNGLIKNQAKREEAEKLLLEKKEKKSLELLEKEEEDFSTYLKNFQITEAYVVDPKNVIPKEDDYEDLEFVIEKPKDYKRLISYFDQKFTPHNFKKPISKVEEQNEKVYVKIEINSFKFSNIDVKDTFFFRAAIYDVENKKKLTEDFTFEMFIDNLDEIDTNLKNKLIETRKTEIYKNITRLFEIVNPNTKMYLVLFVEKIYHGDISDLFKACKEEKIEKYYKKAIPSLKSNSKFKQPFLWGYSKIFISENNSISVKEGDLKITELIRVPDSGMKKEFDIYTEIESVIDSKYKLDVLFKYSLNHITKDKLQQISLNFKQTKNDDEFKKYQFLNNDVDSFDFLLHKYFNHVLSFRKDKSELIPQFHNYLFLYPLTVNFQSKHSNIFFKVTFKSDEKTELKRFKFGKIFERYYISSITNDQKLPQFFDEIKIQLPLDINPNYHLHFEFFHHKNTPSKTGNLYYITTRK
jgi:hypothetical protein